MLRRSAALLLVSSAVTFGAAPKVQQLFDEVRGKVLDNTSRVPRYTCVETIERHQYRPPLGVKAADCASLIEAHRQALSPGILLWRDRLRLDVAVLNGKETFAWAGARQFETTDIEDLISSGSSGSGDFASFLASVFGMAGTRISFLSEIKSPTDLSALFAFTVPLERSRYVYRDHGTGAEKTIGYHGSFLVDEARAELRRLTVEADRFPDDEDMCRVEDVMDYHHVKIGDGDFLLPEAAKMTVLFNGGQEARNETSYSDCREYVGESKISFGDDTPGGDGTTPGAKPPGRKTAAPGKLRAGLRLQIGLKSPIHSQTAAAGDPVTGVILRNVKDVARANDLVHGRVLRIEQRLVPFPRWTVTIRFDSIEHNGGEEALDLRPLDDGYRARRNVVPQERRPAQAGVFIFAGAGDLVLDEKFHSEWETR
ncbi:MAG TPA: hypothetical protein VHZ74_26590 [Bryobacteraceae bacterium]|nr:hypothetical protein [Bryobacteraceae bacterium]